MDAIPSLLSESDAARVSDYLEFCHLISLVDYPTLSWREYLNDVQEEALEKEEDARNESKRADRGPVWVR